MRVAGGKWQQQVSLQDALTSCMLLHVRRPQAEVGKSQHAASTYPSCFGRPFTQHPRMIRDLLLLQPQMPKSRHKTTVSSARAGQLTAMCAWFS